MPIVFVIPARDGLATVRDRYRQNRIAKAVRTQRTRDGSGAPERSEYKNIPEATNNIKSTTGPVRATTAKAISAISSRLHCDLVMTIALCCQLVVTALSRGPSLIGLAAKSLNHAMSCCDKRYQNLCSFASLGVTSPPR